MPSLRLIFMGSPDFAVPSLAALLDAGHEVACVYAQPPRPAGRGHREHPVPVHAFAQERDLPVRTPRSLKDEAERRDFADLGADAAVVAAYGLILPAPILRAPRLGCFNVHASLLPRWRGAAPIQRAILAGDTETGITIMHMDEGLDTGPTVLAERIPIGPATTTQDLHDALAQLGARLVVEALDGIAGGRLTPVPQPARGVTYAAKVARDEGRLDWSRPAAELERVVRSLGPRVWFTHADARVRVLAAHVVANETSAAPGTVLGGPLAVACATGALALDCLQREGRAPMEADAFLRGYPLPAGTRLA
jgi:methionyl-tRNA formyltransferase